MAVHLEKASQLLGELNGIGRVLPNPYILIGPLQTREALTSSSMEGNIRRLMIFCSWKQERQNIQAFPTLVRFRTTGAR
ncbi:Fic/DOC family N-terminal domain-containing protein [Rhodomicrobium sp. Az07]|uniref:Fic/DOC family N-terminal domain-containing protein n=1 Tax=Rhodomicrobium sp. Az07 TaxID=2839034 RepID=UPI0035301CB0